MKDLIKQNSYKILVFQETKKEYNGTVFLSLSPI